MERNEPETRRVFCPLFADELVRRESLQGFETPVKVVGGNEVIEMISELRVLVIVITLDRRFLDRPVHLLDLSIGSRMHRLRQPVFDVEIGGCRIEGMAT
jgi:hypothetical protein